MKTSSRSPEQAHAPQTEPAAASQSPGRSNAFAQDQLRGKAAPGDDPGKEAAADGLARSVLRAATSAQSPTPPAGAGAEGGIPAPLSAAFKTVTGADVSRIKVHRGARAAEAGAQGLAENGEVHLPAGSSLDGDLMQILAHELAHVVLGHAASGAGPMRKAEKSAGLGVAPLQRGDRGPKVERLQQALHTLGYLTAKDLATGPGVFGPRTEAAVMAFQAARRLTTDGQVGPITDAALAAAISAGAGSAGGGGGERGTTTLTGKPPLRVGSEGVGVKEMQKRLNRYGGTLGVDGEFGPTTERSLKAFQAANGLTADGICGPATAAALNSETSKSFTVGKSGGTSTGTGTGTGEDAPPADPSATYNVDDADPKNILGSNKLNPTVKKLAAKTIETLQAQGLSPYLFEGHRTMETQNALYEKGRTKPGSIVTYVKGGGSWHNYGLAVDIVFWNKSHTGPSWDSKHAWQKLGKAGKAAGFTRWMGDSGWDFPHFEHHPKWGNGCTNLLSTYQSGGFSAVWKKVM
jgi:peptidoglycan hydrolase-like protein with peptidoglycan-binding domain